MDINLLALEERTNIEKENVLVTHSNLKLLIDPKGYVMRDAERGTYRY